MRQPPKHKKGWSTGVGLLTLVISIFAARSAGLLWLCGAVMVLAFSHSVWFSPWVLKVEGFSRLVRRMCGTVCVASFCFVALNQLWCVAKKEDSRLDSISPADLAVTMTFHIPTESAAELYKLEGQDLLKKMFCQTDRMHLEIVLVPGSDPLDYSPMDLIVEASNLEEACDLKSSLAVLDDARKDHRLNVNIVVLTHDWYTVTLEVKIYGYDLDYELHGWKHVPMREYGKRLPIYNNIGASPSPIPAGKEEFSLPMGLATIKEKGQEASKISDRVNTFSFDSVDVVVKPNPNMGSLSSSWTLRREKASMFVKMAFPTPQMSVMANFFQDDDDCWLSSFFGS